MTIDEKVCDTIAVHSQYELALGYLRYEALRKLNPRQFSALNKRNMAGENFDEMVDEMVVKR